MGLVLQIIGILFIIATLVVGMITIVGNGSATLTVIFLIIGSNLIRIGRKIR